MHKTTIYLPDDLRSELDVAARATGQSQADLIRRAIRAYLGDHPRGLPPSVGRYHAGAFAARDDEAALQAAWGTRRPGGA